MKTLYVSDMDGTLLGADSKISPQSASIISDLSRRGVLITVATARTPATVSTLLADTYTTIPAIVMTGAALWNRRTGAYSELHYIPENLAGIVERECDAAGLCPFVYTMPDDGTGIMQVYHTQAQLNSIEEEFQRERSDLPLKRFNLGTKAPDGVRGRKILYFAMGTHDGIFDAGRRLAERTDCAVSYYPDIFNPDLALLEVFAPGVSKASAILSLKRQLGADRLVVFGDNLNDISMLSLADKGVAVENAVPQVKAAADCVIGPNTSDAVARYILSDFSNTTEK